MHNAIINFLKSKNLLFPASTAHSTGKAFIKNLTDCLWYIDGHHETLKKQSCPVPEVFHQFFGFNTPELSKHRKRQIENLNFSVLKALTMSLFEHLLASFWNNSPWKEFQIQVENLAINLSRYTEYLSSQNKVMKEIHLRPTRQLCDTMSIKYIPASDGIIFQKFDSLSRTLLEKNLNEFVFLNDYTPDLARRRYDFLQNLTNNGLRFQLCFLHIHLVIT